MQCAQCEEAKSASVLPCGHGACAECLRAIQLAACGCTLCGKSFELEAVLTLDAGDAPPPPLDADGIAQLQLTLAQCTAAVANCKTKRGELEAWYKAASEQLEATVCSIMASIETMRASAMRHADGLLANRLKAIEDAENCARVHALQVQSALEQACCARSTLDALTQPLHMAQLPVRFEFVFSKQFIGPEIVVHESPAVRLDCQVRILGDQHEITCIARDELDKPARIKDILNDDGASDTARARLHTEWKTEDDVTFTAKLPNCRAGTLRVSAALLNGAFLETSVVLTNTREVLVDRREIDTESARLDTLYVNNYMSDDGAFLLRLKSNLVIVLDATTMTLHKSYVPHPVHNIYTCAAWIHRTAYVLCSNGTMIIDDMDGVIPPRQVRVCNNWPTSAMAFANELYVAFNHATRRYSADGTFIQQEHGLNKFVFSDGRTLFDGRFAGWVPGGYNVNACENSVRVGKYFYGPSPSEQCRVMCRRSITGTASVCPEVQMAAYVFHVASLDHLYIFTATHMYIYKINV